MVRRAVLLYVVLTVAAAGTAEEEDIRRTGGVQAADILGVGCGSLVLEKTTSQAD